MSVRDVDPMEPQPRTEELQKGTNGTPLPQKDHGIQQKGRRAVSGITCKSSLPTVQEVEEGFMSSLCSWIVHNQIGLSVNCLLLLFLAHFLFPRARPTTRKFFALSYYDPTTNSYTQGWDDLCLVSFYIVVFMGLRAFVIDYILTPCASWGGIQKRKAKIRFAEQAWVLVYDSSSCGLGMWIMCRSSYWLNLRELWTHFPTRSMDGSMKWYYLAQFAFWLQQIMVVNIEERRKDHWQMFTHHIITCALIFTSYGYYQTKVGNLILCMMDGVDVLLAFAKILKYLGYQSSCDVAFGIFIVAWFVLRHVVFMLICWSIYTVLPVLMPYGCYYSMTGVRFSDDGGTELLRQYLQPFRDPGGTVCFNERIHYTFLALLLALQGVMLVWFGMIMRVAYKVLSGAGADDSRSDDEDDTDMDEEEDIEAPQFEKNRAGMIGKPLEEEVGVEGLQYSRRMSPGRQFRKPGARATGLSIPGHSDRKELLGRIGCDKPT